MRTPSSSSKDPIDQLRVEARRRIERYGFTKTVVGTGECAVPGCKCEPEAFPYAYTLGMERHGSPDFVTLGLPMSVVSRVIDPVCELVMQGFDLGVSRDYRFALDNGPVVSLVEVPDLWVEHDPDRVGAWFDLYAPRWPRFLQIVWRDESDHAPWDPACNPAVAASQPILADDPFSVPPRAA